MDGIPIFRTPTWNGSERVFGLGGPKKTSLSFTGCKCDEVRFIPHAHGTHIEGRGHIKRDFGAFPLSLAEPKQTIIINDLTKVEACEYVEIVIVHKKEPKMSGFCGLDKDYLPRLLQCFPRLCILGINEPSFDPKVDEGRLEFHKTFFDLLPDGFLIELLDLTDDRIECNYIYECRLNPYFITDTDAIPCCPILYPGRSNKNAQ